jgi:thymidylate kinase
LLRVTEQTGKRPAAAGGKIIALVGSDGSGKSTIAAELNRWLWGKIDARTVYLGSGDGSVGIFSSLRRAISRLVGLYRKARPKSVGVSAVGEGRHGPGKASGPKGWGLSIYGLLVMLLSLEIASNSLSKVLRAAEARRRGTLVIADRYPQTEFPGIYDGPRIQVERHDSFVRRLLSRIEFSRYRRIESTPPDVLIRLHVPVELALLRKPDHNPEAVKQKVAATPKLRFDGARIVDVDASKPLDQVMVSVKKAVWDSL